MSHFSDGVIHFPRIITRREWQQLNILAIQQQFVFDANLNTNVSLRKPRAAPWGIF
jgi:hypothetical protein